MLRELDSRTRDDGLEVNLYWDDEDDVVILRVTHEDPANLIPQHEVCKVPSDRALHAFRHPTIYVRRQRRKEASGVE